LKETNLNSLSPSINLSLWRATKPVKACAGGFEGGAWTSGANIRTIERIVVISIRPAIAEKLWKNRRV